MMTSRMHCWYAGGLKNHQYHSVEATSCNTIQYHAIPCAINSLAKCHIRSRKGSFLVGHPNYDAFSERELYHMMHRWWREVGEGPNFWTGFKLSFNINTLSEEKLVEVLSLRRLETLCCIHLSGWGFMNWQLPQRLKVISDSYPSIRSLSIGPQMILKFYKKEEATKLAEALHSWLRGSLGFGKPKKGTKVDICCSFNQ